MEMSEEKNEIFKGLNIFRKKLKQPVKDKTNPFFRSTYVDLSGVTKSIDEALDGTGLAYFQNPVANAPTNSVGVETIITHESGQYIKCDPFIAPVMPNKKGNRTAQEFGSAKTYASRYSLASAFGISDGVDDDGNSASTNSQSSGKGNYANRPHQNIGSNNNQKPNQSQKSNQASKQENTIVNARNKIKLMAIEFDKETGTKPGTTLQMACELQNVDINTNNMAELTKVGKYLKEKLDGQKKEGLPK